MKICYLDLDETLLGQGGGILRDGAGEFTDASIRVFEALHRAGAQSVLVSGRRLPELAAIGRMLGADGALGELGACDAGYPCEPGQTVHDAIAATGVVDMLLAWADGALERYEPWCNGRFGSHLLIGTVGDDAGELVETISGGTLRLVDNGAATADGRRTFHLLPAQAGKGPAVARDIARRGARPEDCLAVGDSRADLELAEVVGLMAIVRNGVDHDPTLEDDAPWITAGAHGAGALEAVERWLADDPALDRIRRRFDA